MLKVNVIIVVLGRRIIEIKMIDVFFIFVEIYCLVVDKLVIIVCVLIMI